MSVISHYLEHGMTGGLAIMPVVSIDAIAWQLKLARADILADVPGALKRYRYWLEMFYRLRPKPSPYHLEFTNPGD